MCTCVWLRKGAEGGTAAYASSVGSKLASILPWPQGFLKHQYEYLTGSIKEVLIEDNDKPQP